MFAGTPLDLAKHPPGLVIECAVEISLGIRPVVTIVHPADQPQVIGKAQGVLQFKVVARFPGALVDITADLLRTAIAPLLLYLLGQGAFLAAAGGQGRSNVARHLLGVIRVQAPELGQLRAERQRRITGAPYLLTIPVLGRALYIEAVVGVEVDVPAQRTGVVLGVEVGVVACGSNVGEHRFIGVGPLIAAFLGRELPFQALIAGQGVAGTQGQAVEAATVAVVLAPAVFVETIVLHARQRQAQVATVPAQALACVPVIDTALAAGNLQARAMAVGRAAGEDIDHCHQRIGAIADGVGAAEHLDALDVFHGQGDVAPVHRGQAGAVHRTAIDQHLHAPGIVDVAAMVVDRRLVAGAVADHHARYQAQQFGDVARAAGADQFAVEHGHAARDCRRGLFQARGGQNLRQVAVVDEQVVGHGRATEQGSQYQQARERGRAREHGAALYQD
ncbi:hypothetical protein D3C80_908540 [compost metagenome]